MERGKITGRQLAALLLVTRVFWGTIVDPVLTSAGTGRDTWLADILATVVAVPFALLVIKLGTMHPDKTLVEYGLELLGRPLGTVFGLFLAVYFLVLSAGGARALAEAYVIDFMFHTPLVVFVALTVWLASIAARNGLEVVGRVAESVMPLVILVILAILVLPAEKMEFARLLPIAEHGPGPILRGALTSFGFFSEVLSVGMVLPYLSRPGTAVRPVVWAVLLSSVLVTLPPVTIVTLFGPQADSFVSPFLDQARLVRIAYFIERLEVLPLAVWTLMAWLKIGFYQWLAIVTLVQVFRRPDYRPLAYPAGVLTSVLAVLLFRNFYDVVRFMSPGVFGLYGSLTAVGVVGLLLALTLARRVLAGMGGSGR